MTDTRRANGHAALPRTVLPPPAAPTWDRAGCDALIDELQALRGAMREHEARLAPQLAAVDPAFAAGAANLAHYLALRQVDLRPLQRRLAGLGLSSLGRAETHVLANLDQVLGILHRLVDRPWRSHAADEPAGLADGTRLLGRHAEALFGRAPAERRARIMVTLPSQAAHDDRLVAALVAAGMDIARINCAHDDAAAWVAMAGRVRDHARRAGRPVRVLMDLGGPKLRTGALRAGPAVVHLRPERDALGRVVQPARLGLRPAGGAGEVPGAAQTLAVEADWLDALQPGDRVTLTDTRGRGRRLRVVERGPAGVLLEGRRSLWLDDATELDQGGQRARLQDLPATPGALRLYRGTRLRLVPERPGHPADPGHEPPTIGCTLPDALRQARPGDRVWFDDGHLGGVVRRAKAGVVEVEITQAGDGGHRLGADKGINLPDTVLELPALTAQDRADLPTVAAHADIVGLSFTQSAADVDALREALAPLAHDGRLPALMLKLETRRGFEALPEILLAAMRAPAVGVMIARGDLAVECGFERMAELQEEILWACEAAHLPVVWATQVLEGLAKTGMPSRAEITDAAMAGRAECVMLNKGPHVVDAIRTLDDILRRMQAHQDKKSPLLRALKSWDAAGATPPVMS